MEIFKQHYEKVILGALTLAFILALVYLLQMIESASNPDDVRFQTTNIRINPHERKDFKSNEFSENYILGVSTQWQQRTDNSNLGFTADLVVPMHALRCTNKDCRMIIPWSQAKKRKCNFCNGDLNEPSDPPDYESEIAKLDSDGDGMPDRYELKMGFNPLDPSDANSDKDGDGFSNLYEFMVRTDPTDIKSVPPLEKCLYLVALRKRPLPVRLESVQVNPDPADKNSKKNWDISLTIRGNRESHIIGDDITINGVKYKLTDAVYKTKDQQEASVVLAEEASIATLVPYKDNKLDTANAITLEVGKRSYAPDHLAFIRDVRTNRGYRVGRNGTITIKSDDGKTVVFQLIATDAAKESVTLVNVETEVKFLLEKSVRLPKNAFVRKGESGGAEPVRRVAPVRRRRVRN